MICADTMDYAGSSNFWATCPTPVSSNSPETVECKLTSQESSNSFCLSSYPALESTSLLSIVLQPPPFNNVN